MAYKKFPSQPRVGSHSGALYAMADGLTFQVRDDGEWYLDWPEGARHLRGPDLSSLQLWVARVYEQLQDDAKAQPHGS